MSYLRIGGVDLYSEVAGEGEPVLLLHGGFCSLESMRVQSDVLSADYRVFAFERPGHGRSADIEEDYGYERGVADTLAYLDAAGLESAHLVGYSDGAIIGLLMALDHPERVRSLTAISANLDPSVFAEPEAEETPDAEAGPEEALDAEAGSEEARDAEARSEGTRDAEAGSEGTCDAEAWSEEARDAEAGPEEARDAGTGSEEARDAEARSEETLDAGARPEEQAEGGGETAEPRPDIERMHYERLSPDGPEHADVVLAKLFRLWTTQPDIDPKELGRIAAPVLVMAADGDMIPPVHTLLIASSIPGAQLCIVPGTTHYLVTERPELISTIIRDFLRGQSRRGSQTK